MFVFLLLLQLRSLVAGAFLELILIQVRTIAFHNLIFLKRFQLLCIELDFSLIEGLIEVARWRLRSFVRTQTSAKPGEKKTHSGGADGSEEQSIPLSSGSSSAETKDLFQIVSFQKENFVHTRNLDENRYDTIIWYIPFPFGKD